MGEEPERLRAALDWLVARVTFLDPASVQEVPNDQQLMRAQVLAEVERLAGERDEWEQVAKSARNRTWHAEAECERLAGRVAARAEETERRVETIRENVSHVARGCRAATAHNPAPYLNSIEAALVALLAEVGRSECCSESRCRSD